MTETTDPRKGAATKFVKFFGKQHGQGLSEFAAEIKALSDQDVADLVGGIDNGSLTY